MTHLAEAMEVVFIAAVGVGSAAHIYASQYFLPMWKVGFRHREEHRGYWLKALVGISIFVVTVVVGIVAWEIADRWGGGWR